MLTGNTSAATTAWLAFAAAFVTLLGLAFLIIMSLVGEPFGSLNDLCNGLGAVLGLALAWTLYAQHHARNPQLATAALVLAIVGTLISIAGSVLVLSRTTGFFLAGMYTMTGYALLGLWLLALNYGSPGPRGLVVFGLITGGVMALGMAAIPSIFLRIDSFADAAWHTWLGQVGFLGWAILFPIWCLRFWHILRTA